MKKLIKYSLAAFFMTTTLAVCAAEKNTADDQISWIPVDKTITVAKEKNKKFILINLYTDWCGWCKKMDENTFSEPAIVDAMNTNFVSAKFNAETSNPIDFNGKTYPFIKNGARGANQLAMDLGSVGGKLGYPTLVVLDNTGKRLQAFPGYKDIETLSVILRYFESESYKKMDFQQYQSTQ